ncbi:MAG: ATP-binding protein [Streptosporangiaceae bacterium]
MSSKRLVRRSVRLRLTGLYGVLFVLSGAVLLAIATGLTISGSTEEAAPARAASSPGTALSRADARIRDLQNQLSSRTTSSVSHQLLIASVIALGIMAVASVAFGWIMAGRALRPVREMTEAAQRISADNLHERLAVAGPADELKDLGDTIDGLLERLEEAFSAQRRFVANASHELRTPLTTMRAAIDVAIAKPAPVPAQTVALADRLRTELDRIDELLEGLLVLARAQHSALPDNAVFSLSDVAAAALAERASAIGARALRVRASMPTGAALVAGSQALVSRLAGNLIDNAIVHNVEAGWIALSAAADRATATAFLTVENGGAKLDMDQVAQLGQPFRRLGADRTGSDIGSGLGLSIVAAIARAHGGTVDLQARAEGGLRVTVILPLAAHPGLPRRPAATGAPA